MGLKDVFKSKWNHSDWEVRKGAVAKLDDQALLAKMAKNDPHALVRAAAVRKLVDQKALADFARNDESTDVRHAAVESLTDQAVLLEMARSHKDESQRSVAARRLTDQKVLIEFATKDDSWIVRCSAVGAITDHNILLGIAQNDPNVYVRHKAVQKLEDKTILMEIAKKDKEEYVRKEAVKRLEQLGGDKASLEEARAGTGPHPESKRAYEVGQNDPQEGLRILDALLAREPNSRGAYNVYGQLCLKIGDLATARDAFELNISASPDDDHRFDWAYLALIIGLQGDEPKARECAARTTIKIQYDFADSVRNAYIGWRQKKGDTASRLSRSTK